ncbi:MAG: murein hydrolase activator EnvC family protein [Burkholderiales bacterium]
MRFLVFLLTLSAAFLSFADGKEELKELRGRIEALTKELAESEESKSHAADALRESERAISNANRELAKLNAQLQESNKEHSRLTAESRRLEADVADEKSNLAAFLRQRHRSRNDEALKLLLKGEDLNALPRELAYYSILARSRAEFLQSLRTDVEAINQLQAAALDESAKIEALKDQQAKEKAMLKEQRRERAEVLAKVAKQIREQQKEIATLKENEARLAELVARLAKAIKSPRKPEVERVPEPGDDGSEFARLKGSLNLPVNGELNNLFGAPREDGDLSWKGLFIAARPGAAVKAIAAGKVVFADWLRGYGNLMIVDHGEGYMSLYGYNETLHRQVGEAIHAGDIIAEVGSSGGSRAAGVYFEMRHQGKPFDPLAWVRLK